MKPRWACVFAGLFLGGIGVMLVRWEGLELIQLSVGMPMLLVGVSGLWFGALHSWGGIE